MSLCFPRHLLANYIITTCSVKFEEDYKTIKKMKANVVTPNNQLKLYLIEIISSSTLYIKMYIYNIIKCLNDSCYIIFSTI